MSEIAPSDVTLVLTTAPSAEVAETVVERLLEGGLIACANMVPGVRSLYRWQGQIRRDDEVLVLMKSTGAAYDRLEAALAEMHPYDVPEIVAVPLSEGLAPYLSWVMAEVGGSDE